MSSRIWLRFEKKKKDGAVLKLRIQDLPPERIGEATALMVKYFLRDEPLRKAIDFLKNPDAIEEYEEYINKSFHDPASRNVMCCADNDDETPIIMGISSIAVATAADYWDVNASNRTKETKKMNALYLDDVEVFDVMKEFNLTSYYAGKSILVVPEYRGYGIAEKFLTVRRLMCAPHNIPITAAWMTNFGTQIAAERDGWETVCEVNYEEMLRKHDLPIEDVPLLPLTMTFVVARPHPEYSSLLC